MHHLPDAPPPPDTSFDAATSGVVDITITDLAGPVAGVTVYFQNADSSLVLTGTTDASGVASATMEPGGYVTALNPFPNAGLGGGPLPPDLRTFAGIKPGDHLRLAASSGRGSFGITVTAPVDDAAFEYKLYTSCSDGSSAGAFGSGSGFAPQLQVFINGCALVDFAMVTFDANGAPAHGFFHEAVPVTAGATIDLADVYVAPVSYQLSYTGVPDGVSTVSVNHLLASPSGPLMRTILSADVSTNAASVQFPEPPVTGAFAAIVTSYQPTSFGAQYVVDWGSQPTALAMTGTLLPAYTAPPSLDIASHAITWTSTGGAAQPDLAIVNMEIDRASTFWYWNIAAPLGTASVTLPVLPGDAATLNPLEGDTPFFFNLVTAKVPGGYDAVRDGVLTFNGPEGVVVGASGRALVEETGVALRTAHPGRPNAAPLVFGRR